MGVLLFAASLLSIPKLGVVMPIENVGIDDGEMQSPVDADNAGLLQVGNNTLVDGHSDWAGKLKPFGRLRLLEAGDTLELIDDDGNIIDYSVQTVALVSVDDALPYLQQTDQQTLTLISCGGRFDTTNHIYLDRWIVQAIAE